MPRAWQCYLVPHLHEQFGGVGISPRAQQVSRIMTLLAEIPFGFFSHLSMQAARLAAFRHFRRTSRETACVEDCHGSHVKVTLLLYAAVV